MGLTNLIGLVRASLTLLAVIAALAIPRTSRGDGVERVAIYVRGNDAEAVRKEIGKLIPPGLNIETRAFTQALRKRGVEMNPKFDQSKKLGDQVNQALVANKLDLAIVVRVQKSKAGRSAHLLVFKRGEPKAQVDETVELGKKASKASEASALSSVLSPFLTSVTAKPVTETAEPTRPAAPSPPSAPEQLEPRASSEATRKKDARAPPTRAQPKGVKGSALPLLEFGLALGWGARTFHFAEPLSSTLRPYSSWAVLLSELDLEMYPAARSTGFFRNLGFRGRALFALPFESEAKDMPNGTFGTRYLALQAGLRYRLPLSDARLILVSAAFGAQAFSFSNAGSLSDQVPEVRYRYVAPELAANIGLGRAALIPSFSYRFILDGGALLDRFPRASLGGVEAGLDARLRLGQGNWQLRLLARYERYFYAMHSEPGDAPVAGGALDQYFTAVGGAVCAF